MRLHGWMGMPAVCLLLGCAAAEPAALPPRPPDTPFVPGAVDAYKRGLAEMAKLDASDGWSDSKCTEVAGLFLDAVRQQGAYLPEAVFNAGLAEHRCGHAAKAREHYSAVLARNPKAFRARAQLVRLALLDSPEPTLDGPIAEMQRAVADADYRSPEVLVELARLQLRRGNAVKDAEGDGDIDRAQKNLRRALAIDDGFMPAHAELAAYYLERARRASGKTTATISRGMTETRARGEALDLAFLVATQALQKDPRYAQLHNTLGLIAVEAGDQNRAVKAFGEARQLDPRLFEAHMNYASVNLSFRGFVEAERAYRAAILVRPNDYDATLGLALSLRGQVSRGDAAAPKLAEAEAFLEKAKKLAPARPEAYFNHAVFVQEFKADAGSAANAELRRAIALYEAFVERAKGRSDMAATVADVTSVPSLSDDECIKPAHRGSAACKRGRIHDLREIIAFNELNAAEQARAKENAQTRSAIVEASGGATASP